MKAILTIATAALIASTACHAGESIEVTDYQKTRFAELDVDGNGFLNLTELRGTTEGWMSKAGYNEEKQVQITGKKLTRLDIDKDKQISLVEFATDLQNQAKNKKKKKKNG